MIKYLTMATLFIIPFVNAQVCNTNMDKTNLDGQYIKHEQGYVIDAVNRLLWESCSVGQTYSNKQCHGAPTEFALWRDALQYANGREGYRIPNIKELETIVERSCFEPAIDQVTFPDTPLAIYWSNTPNALGNQLEGYAIDFTDGSEIIRDVNRPKHLRLIIDLNQIRQSE